MIYFEYCPILGLTHYLIEKPIEKQTKEFNKYNKQKYYNGKITEKVFK